MQDRQQARSSTRSLQQRLDKGRFNVDSIYGEQLASIKGECRRRVSSSSLHHDSEEKELNFF